MTGRTAFCITFLWISLLSWQLMAFAPRPHPPRTTPTTSMAPNFLESIRQAFFKTEKEILLRDFPVPDSEAVRKTLSLIAVHPQQKENKKKKKNNIFHSIQQWWNQQAFARNDDDFVLQKDVEILSAEEYLSLRRELRPDFQIPINSNPPITVDVEEAIQKSEISKDRVRPRPDFTPSTSFDSVNNDPQVILIVPQTTPANVDALRPQRDSVRPISTTRETQPNQPARTSYLESLEAVDRVARSEGTLRESSSYLESLDASESFASRVSQIPRQQELEALSNRREWGTEETLMPPLEDPGIASSDSNYLDVAVMKEESLKTLSAQQVLENDRSQVPFVDIPKPSGPTGVIASVSYLESLEAVDRVVRPEATSRQSSYLESLDSDASESFAGRMSLIPRQQETTATAMLNQQGWGTKKETTLPLKEQRVTFSDSSYLDGAIMREESLKSLPTQQVQESRQYSSLQEMEDLKGAINTFTDNNVRNQLDQGGTSEVTKDDTPAEIDPTAYRVSLQQESLFTMGESAADSDDLQSSTISSEETANKSRVGYKRESTRPVIPQRASFSPVRSTVKDYNSTGSSPYLASMRGLKSSPFNDEKEPIIDTRKPRKSFEATGIGTFSPVRASIKNVNSTSSSPYLTNLRGQAIAPFDFNAATFAASAKDESVTPNEDTTPLEADTPDHSATQRTFADDLFWSPQRAQPTKSSFAPVLSGIKYVNATSSSPYLTALRGTTTTQPRMNLLRPKVTTDMQANQLPVGLKDVNEPVGPVGASL
ncbi:hypothetical protein FisN_33Hh001, partial [Fistulifera solaris]